MFLPSFIMRLVDRDSWLFFLDGGAVPQSATWAQEEPNARSVLLRLNNTSLLPENAPKITELIAPIHGNVHSAVIPSQKKEKHEKTAIFDPHVTVAPGCNMQPGKNRFLEKEGPSEEAGQRLSSTADIKELSGLVFSWSFSCFRLSVCPCFENMSRNTMADSLDQSFYRSIQSSRHENFQSWSSLSSIREAINHIFHLERRPLLRLSDHHTLTFVPIYIPSVR